MNRRLFLASGLAASVAAAEAEPGVPFLCPMDPEVRSQNPGRCPRCGMQLVAGIPPFREFRVRLTLSTRAPQPGIPVRITFRPEATGGNEPIHLAEIHERLLHLFVVSRDLRYFAHEHPEMQPDGTLVCTLTFPYGGEYRLLHDFYPAGGSPQLVPATVFVNGTPPRTQVLQPDLTPKIATNLRVEMLTIPTRPLSGQKTVLQFRLSPGDRLEPYLGAAGHMLIASEDLIDLIHTHPADTNGRDLVEFAVIFPRTVTHRIWVQFASQGVVNTAAFNLPLAEL